MNKIPLLVKTDFYHVDSFNFESKDALEKSTYYLTFRTAPYKLTSVLSQDERIVFGGIQPFVENYLQTPITKEDIFLAEEFYKGRAARSNGSMDNMEFPKEQWIRIVDEMDGYLPLHIEAVPEGTVIYPGEPAVRVVNTVPGYGWLAAHVESSLMNHCWPITTTLTMLTHWLNYLKLMIKKVEPELNDEELTFRASLMFHDFSRRSSIFDEENALLGYYRLMLFPGTDTADGAYMAWRDGAPSWIGSSVSALAHRIVQGYEEEKDCYNTLYNSSPNNSIMSFVPDCYDFFYATKNYLLPLSLRSRDEKNGKIVVVRPDSGDALQQILYTIELAIANGLYTKKGNYTYGTLMKVIEGNGMSFTNMIDIIQALINRGHAPHGWLVFGVGGTLHNEISRDTLSTKYALCAKGADNQPVIKLSNTPGKETKPLCKIIRGGTYNLVLPNEPGQDIMKTFYYNGNYKRDRFMTIRERIHKEFASTNCQGNGDSTELKNAIATLRRKYVKND